MKHTSGEIERIRNVRSALDASIRKLQADLKLHRQKAAMTGLVSYRAELDGICAGIERSVVELEKLRDGALKEAMKGARESTITELRRKSKERAQAESRKLFDELNFVSKKPSKRKQTKVKKSKA